MKRRFAAALALPVLLTLSAVEPRLGSTLRTHGVAIDAAGLRSTMFTIAAFIAFVSFYSFAGAPTLRLVPGLPHIFQLLVVATATLFLVRRIGRRQGAFTEETLARKIIANWKWEDIPPPRNLREAFLIHTVRSQSHEEGRQRLLELYKQSVRDSLQSGVVSRGEVHRLESLRSQMGIAAADHERVMAELAERSHTPLITPTAMLPNVRRLGSFAFSTALTYQLQAQKMAAYATGDLGFRRFCILHPDTAYGREMARLFAQEARQRDGEIIAIESYKEGDSDVGAQLKRMKTEDLKKYGLAVPVDPTKIGGKLTKLDRKVLYTPGFDAIFIPGRAADVGLIAAQLNFHDMKVPFLGSNGWNAPDFARTADQSIDGAVFVDGFFVDSPNPTVQDFVDRYKKRFQNSPTLFAMQGYEAAKFVIEAIKKGATSGEAIREYLTMHQDLPALAGPAAFAEDGTLNRPLFLIQVKRGRFTQVD